MYAYKGKQYTIILFVFLSTFFVYLLGRDLILYLYDFDTFVVNPFSTETLCHIYFSMHLSLFFIYIGFLISNVKRKIVFNNINDYKQIQIKKISKKIFYYTIPFKIVTVFFAAYNMIKYSYVDLYANKLSSLYVFDRLSQINYLCFILFLMTYPSKKEMFPLLKIVIPVYSLSILGGSRGDMMYFLLFIFAYLMYRDYMSKSKKKYEEIFITRKVKIILLSIAPFLLVFLTIFANIRSKTEIESNGFYSDLLSFFIQQGGSYSLIGFSKEYATSLPTTNISYTFGPILQFIEPLYAPKHLDHLTYDAIYGNNLGATMTYLTNPSYYYRGGGLGTQYIAEIYTDFGYIGIVFFSWLLGILLVKMRFFYSKSIYINTLLAFGMVSIFSLPRDYYLSWLLGVLSFWNIIFLLFLNTYINHKIKRLKSRNTEIIC